MRDKLRARALLSSSGTQHTWFIYFYIINSGRYPTWSYSLHQTYLIDEAKRCRRRIIDRFALIYVIMHYEVNLSTNPE